ncbi:MAG TPA: hypothetical protein VM733_05450 [Thermoanaerobaculia bacterium]|nr:hypothetical protein [Thermoanaerobaculia bacterium]
MTTELLGLLAYLILPLVGMVVWRFAPVEARWSVATAAGALIVALVMSALSVIGVEWSRTILFTLLAIIIGAGVYVGRTSVRPDGLKPVVRLADAGTAIAWLATLYGVVTARESCGDLAFTWGPKAIRWFRAGALDPQVLKTWPQLTVDYPPLQTLLLSFSNLWAHQFPWWAAVLAGPLLLIPTLMIVRVWSRDAIGTMLVACTFAYAFALAYPHGCAEPPLLLFETIAIAALVFIEERKTQTFLVAMALAGCVYTKLEGTTFAIAVFLTIAITLRRPKQAFIVIAPAAILFAAWMTFVFRNGLYYMYSGATLPIYWSALPVTLKTLLKMAKFELWWLPYLVPIALIAMGNMRRALAPISIALLTSGATVYFYIHYPDPVWWIESSSPRVILTPMLALLIGALAAYARVPPHGVVPQGEEAEGSGGPAGRDSRGALGQV